MDLVDTHCHLQFDKLAKNISSVMEAASNAGVNRMVCVGTSVEDSQKAIEYAAKYGNVWAAVGAHPHDGKHFDFKNDPAKLKTLAGQPRVVAFGEIGLDFYKDYSPRDEQEKMFRAQLEIGLGAGLPIIFHVRDAWRDFWRILQDYDGIKGVVHSFSSGTKQLNTALDRGLYIGLNGIMTFTKDQAQLDAAKQVPLDKLVLETDAPFLTPAKYRGDMCEPKHITDIAEFLADLRGESIDELSKATTKNAVSIFNLK